MKDRRSVDDLSIEELERILLTKRREARLARLRQMDQSEQVVSRDPLSTAQPDPNQTRPVTVPLSQAQFQGAGASAAYRPSPADLSGQERSANWAKLLHYLSAPLRIKWGFILGKILLLVEIGVVIALVYSVMMFEQERTKLNQESAATFVPPTPTPAPVIDVVVLPGGHTPPNSPGGSQPAPIPEHLKHLVQEITPLPVPTPGPEQAKRIVIPAIGVDAPVVEGDDPDALKRGAGHHIGSANPGTAGNCIITAHNDIYGEIFRHLNDMEPGDEIFIHTTSQVYRYTVTMKQIIEPTQVEVMEPTRDPVVTLISCYPYLLDTHRVVVIGELTP